MGTIVYMIVRPPEFLDDVRLRELEMQAAEARLTQLDYQLCPHCDYEVKGDFLRCPSCMRKLKERCYCCGKPIDPAWKLCPFCEAETGAEPAALRAAAGAGGGRRRERDGRLADRATRGPPPDVAAATDPEPDKEPTMDRTLILVKPDAFARGLTGEIIARFERKGLRIVALEPHDDGPRARRAALRRARRQAVLRRAGRLHHLRPARRDGARGRRGGHAPPAR